MTLAASLQCWSACGIIIPFTLTHIIRSTRSLPCWAGSNREPIFVSRKKLATCSMDQMVGVVKLIILTEVVVYCKHQI